MALNIYQNLLAGSSDPQMQNIIATELRERTTPALRGSTVFSRVALSVPRFALPASRFVHRSTQPAGSDKLQVP